MARNRRRRVLEEQLDEDLPVSSGGLGETSSYWWLTALFLLVTVGFYWRLMIIGFPSTYNYTSFVLRFLRRLPQPPPSRLDISIPTIEEPQEPAADHPNILDFASYRMLWATRSRFFGALLAGLQELAASWIAKDHRRNGNYFTRRVAKTAFYASIFGMSIYQVMTWVVSKIFGLFAPSLGLQIVQLVFCNITIVPLQAMIDAGALALIAGARTHRQVRATVRVTLAHYIKFSWISTAACAILAHMFLPPRWWPVCFGLGGFFVRVVSDARTKKMRINALRKKRFWGLPPEYVENRETEKRAEGVASSRGPAHGEGELFGTGKEQPDRVRVLRREREEVKGGETRASPTPPNSG